MLTRPERVQVDTYQFGSFTWNRWFRTGLSTSLSRQCSHSAGLDWWLLFCNVTSSQLDQTCKSVQQQRGWQLMTPPQQEQDEALLTKVRIAAWGLAPLAEGGVPVLRLQQRPLLNQPLLELQTLIRRSSSGSPRALSLSPCPRFLQEKRDAALISRRATQPARLRPASWCNPIF